LAGKPWFFQLFQKWCDKQDGALWDSEIPRAPPVPADEPAQIKVIYGPSRYSNQRHLSWEHGTNWGPNDPRDGRAWKDLSIEERYSEDPPPAYCEIDPLISS